MSVPAPITDEPQPPAPAEIASELHSTLGEYVDSTVRAWRETLAELEKK